MTENEALESRVAELEERVFGNGQDSKKVKKRIGQLQTNMRKAAKKVDELEDQIDNLDRRIKRSDELEDLKADVKKIKLDIEKETDQLQDDMQDKIDQMSQLVEDAHSLSDHIDEQIDKWNKLSREHDEMVLEQAEQIGQWVLRSHQFSQMFMFQFFDNYVPKNENSERLWDVMVNLHLYSHEDQQHAQQLLHEWQAFVDNNQEHAERDLKESPEIFDAFIVSYQLLRNNDMSFTSNGVSALMLVDQEFGSMAVPTEKAMHKNLAEYAGLDIDNLTDDKVEQAVEETPTGQVGINLAKLQDEVDSDAQAHVEVDKQELESGEFAEKMRADIDAPAIVEIKTIAEAMPEKRKEEMIEQFWDQLDEGSDNAYSQLLNFAGTDGDMYASKFGDSEVDDNE